MNLLHAYRTRPPTPATTAAPPAGPATALLPPWASREMTLVLSAVVLIGIARMTPALSGLRVPIAWLAALAFVATFSLVTLRSVHGRALVALVALWGVCGIVLAALPVGTTALVIAVVTITQASRLPVPLGPATAVVAGLGYEAATIVAIRLFDPGSVLSSALGLIFAYLAASGFRRLRDEKQKTEALLREVIAGRDAQVRAAALDERAHIAREIHDILAHTLSALAVQLEGTRLLVEQRPGDPAALAALERAGGLAREGLEETKRAVGALRGDALPGPEELPRLVADFERDTDIPCRLSVEGTPVALSPEARLALYRTAQEALTNVRKHATAARVELHLRYDVGEATLTVENDGSPRPAHLAGGGHGLEGMRERAELAHGRLEAGPTPTGFRVCLWLPA